MKDLENNSCARLSLQIVIFLGACAACVIGLILVENMGRTRGWWL
jgi:hypothetical protein